MKKSIIYSLLLCLLLPIFQSLAQDESSPPPIIIMTRLHWNMENEDFDMDEWKKLESEYHQKVTMKNEFIIGSEVLLHAYTPDNSELLSVSVHSNWENIDKSNKRDGELIKAAWPEKEGRDAFFKKRNEYYSNMHSDEMYSGLPFSKSPEGLMKESVLVYMRTGHVANPEGGTNKEIRALRKEYVEHVINKNEDILGYYPMRHLYGADSRELVEVFVVKSMKELELMNTSKTKELVDAHWTDEEKRKEFFKKMNSYSDAWHGDLIYSTVPELSK